MADKKATKKAPKTNDMDKKTVAELKNDLLLARKGLYDGTLANPHHIKAIRKEIARKLTEQRNSEIESLLSISSEAVRKNAKRSTANKEKGDK
ncbi:MAG: 50S ribosomal protein L29 [Candidatus Saccharibacteria bacterium]|nr:50S ribosomal protein L29 [Candidatus Saccharibacteria bacterium]